MRHSLSPPPASHCPPYCRTAWYGAFAAIGLIQQLNVPGFMGIRRPTPALLTDFDFCLIVEEKRIVSIGSRAIALLIGIGNP